MKLLTLPYLCFTLYLLLLTVPNNAKMSVKKLINLAVCKKGLENTQFKLNLGPKSLMQIALLCQNALHTASLHSVIKILPPQNKSPYSSLLWWHGLRIRFLLSGPPPYDSKKIITLSEITWQNHSIKPVYLMFDFIFQRAFCARVKLCFYDEIIQGWPDWKDVLTES